MGAALRRAAALREGTRDPGWGGRRTDKHTRHSGRRVASRKPYARFAVAVIVRATRPCEHISATTFSRSPAFRLAAVVGPFRRTRVDASSRSATCLPVRLAALPVPLETVTATKPSPALPKEPRRWTLARGQVIPSFR